MEGKWLNEEINIMFKEREKEEEDFRIKCECFIYYLLINGMWKELLLIDLRDEF